MGSGYDDSEIHSDPVDEFVLEDKGRGMRFAQTPTHPQLAHWSVRSGKDHGLSAEKIHRAIYDTSLVFFNAESTPVRAQNYRPTDAPGTLLNKIKNNEYEDYWVLRNFSQPSSFNESTLALGGGIQIHSPELVSVLVRLFVMPQFRMAQYPQHLLHLQVAHLIKMVAAGSICVDASVIVTFNDHNRAGYEAIRSGKSLGRAWSPVFRLFEPQGKQTINGVPQWVCAVALSTLSAPSAFLGSADAMSAL